MKWMKKGIELLNKDSRGYTLPYVLMILAVLSLFIPVLMNMMSTRQQSDIQRTQLKEATYVAESAVESYIEYLKTFTSAPSAPDVGVKFPGQTVSIPLPEGNSASYTFSCVPDNTITGQYNVTVTATVGKQTKQIRYSFNITPSSNGGSTNNNGGGSGTGTVSSNPLLNSSTPSSSNINGLITPGGNGITTEQYQTYFQETIPTSPTLYLAGSSGPTFLSTAQIDQINNSYDGTNPVVVQVTASSNGGVLNIDSPIDFSVPVVLYITGPTDPVTGLPTQVNLQVDDKLQMSGLLIVNGNMSVTENGNVNSVDIGTKSASGSIIVSNNFNIDPGSFVDVYGTVAAGSTSNKIGSPHLEITAPSQSTIYSYSNGFSWSPNPVRTQ